MHNFSPSVAGGNRQERTGLPQERAVVRSPWSPVPPLAIRHRGAIVRLYETGVRHIKIHVRIEAEAFELDSRIDRYQGKRPIGVYRWDQDCLIDVVSFVPQDPKKAATTARAFEQALSSTDKRGGSPG